MWAWFRRFLRAVLLLASSAVLLLVAMRAIASEANSAEPEVSVPALLEGGWKPSLAAYEVAHKQYLQLRAANARDLRASYAMTLVAIQHHKLREASQFLTEALAARPNNLHLRRVRLWLLFAGKDYKTALAEMPGFAKDVAAIKPDQGSAESIREHAQALGEMIGFAEGPASDAIKAAETSALAKYVADALPPEAIEAFNAARSSIVEKEEQLQKELEEVRTKSKLDQDAQREVDLAQLRQQRELFQTQAAALPAAYERRAAQLQASLQKEIAKNKITIEYDSKTGAVKSQKGSHQQEIETLQRKIASLPALQAADLAQLEDQDGRAAKRIAKLEREAETAVKSAKAESGQSTVLRKRMESFSTYCEFPLDAERAKLLDSFQKK